MTAESSSKQLDQPLILIIDDDPISRRLIRFWMEKEGYAVAEAVNGQEGLAVFQKTMPDIILLDFMMPVMDGLEFCEAFRHLETVPKQTSLENENLESTEAPQSRLSYQQELVAYQQAEDLLGKIARTPILMITAREDDESVTQAFEAGATDFITKPIHWAILRQRVRHLIYQAKLYQRLEATNVQLQRLAALDPLTQLANRRVFDLVLERQWRLMLRKQIPLSIIFIDVDFFKNYNDTYGHQAGDHCLFEVAQAIASQVQRPTDLVARYGGEEMIVILPDTASEGAQCLGERIIEQVRSLGIPHRTSLASPVVTVSLGVASAEPGFASTPEKFVEIADQALYEAKAQGRNQMVAKVLGAG
ncbi:two-component response regulator/ GGDEF domain protein [[Synechococcus] sp. NIES-970]|uniref:GGDEF domain-containing response regulator n=1 Tax=Picosynechococcus sp. NKBG15041c TaxID=1407650 RepID=UPI000422021F|nr:PleD family two-component system response regulator [Picosynechococcus sp. NKBG15041c]BAW95117.1 two-component response regulator/ GGDEF domain protein [[Synechococcus] sp. NIES-970]